MSAICPTLVTVGCSTVSSILLTKVNYGKIMCVSTGINVFISLLYLSQQYQQINVGL